MAKLISDSFGKSEVEHFACKEEKISAFVDKSGGPVDPFGDMEKKDKSAIDMNEGEAFNHKFVQQVDAMGSEYPKAKGNKGQFKDDKDDHFKTEEANDAINPFGTEAGKSKSHQTSKRG